MVGCLAWLVGCLLVCLIVLLAYFVALLSRVFRVRSRCLLTPKLLDHSVAFLVVYLLAMCRGRRALPPSPWVSRLLSRRAECGCAADQLLNASNHARCCFIVLVRYCACAYVCGGDFACGGRGGRALCGYLYVGGGVNLCCVLRILCVYVCVNVCT